MEQTASETKAPSAGTLSAGDSNAGRELSTKSIPPNGSGVKPPKPQPKPVHFGAIPAPMCEIPRWVVWRYTWDEEKGKWDKPPLTVEGYNASSIDPSTWTTFDAALDAYQNGNGFDGMGIVLTDDGDLFGGDLDHCVQDDGSLETWAAEIVLELGTYTEFSPSGRGLRIIGRGKLPPGRRRDGQIELYDTGRYLTITGDHVPGTSATIEERQAELEALHARLFPAPEKPKARRRPAEPVDLDDAELIRKAQVASNGAKFARLWAGDWSDYDSQSEADLGLCNLLVYWTGGDPARVDRLFRQSGLTRDKWDKCHYSDGRTYGRATIDKALADVTESYSPGKKQNSDTPEEAPEQVTAEPVHLTDVGNGRRLVARHGQDLRYCERLGGWLAWDGRRWAADENGEVARRAKETARAIFDEARECPDDDRRKALYKHGLNSESKYRVAAMMAMAQSELPVVARPEDFDRDPWLLNVSNGTIDLRTGGLLPHQRDDLITRLAPVEYDPEAEAPTWAAFLDRVMDGNQELIAFLQRAIGYTLGASTREQVLFILFGGGSNGKSTFSETVRALLGDYAQQTPVDTLMIKHGQTIPNDVARLRGARLVTASEAEEGQRLAESLVKAMTGGDALAARFLHAEWFEFVPVFKLWLHTNHKPTIYGTDLAIWRRIRLVPFTVTIPPDEQDRDLGRKLQAELPGILAWAVQGCLAWQRDGLGAPEEVTQATQDYRAEMDKLGGFLSDCCVLDAKAQAQAGDLYQAYKDWCEANGEREVSGTRFGRQLAERGFEKERDNTGHVAYVGIGLLAE
jgi:putative DNA primase/helicase